MREPREGRRIEIRGTVQGVGFRPWVLRLALANGIAGRVWNDAQGVTIEAFGSTSTLECFLRGLSIDLPPAAVIRDLHLRSVAAEGLDNFVIIESEISGDHRVSIPPDLATCPACLAEIFDPGDRRYGYPFTNCTSCGPRFTIARDVPYDRPATTMAGFVMCPECQREYTTVADRRFHAQPNACPECGPRLRVFLRSGDELTSVDPIAAAAQALQRGLVVAIKGIGGFHLACDATSPPAVTRLRARKRREEKPFAVMVPDLGAAEQLADLSPEERRLLESVERPIVLCRRRAPATLAPEVSPGNPLVGILLAYSPLHHLLLAAVGTPLVMTSGNLSEEPIARTNAEAIDRLNAIADLFLVHDREIVTRCDDSVARIINGHPVVFRRSRGFVPRPVPVAHHFPRPVLAVGGHLKNTFCFGIGDEAYFGPHIGDLENVETYDAFVEAVERMERFLRVEPQVVAHDMHPDYLSTRYALGRGNLEPVAVQHHHAHVASAMAEHSLAGPVIGVVYDGTGYGTDGTSWGGEILLADAAGFERLATLRPIRLAGGDTAVRHVWRIALALLDDAFEGEPPLDAFSLFRKLPRNQLDVVRAMIAGDVNSPVSHGLGRYFDGLGALVLGRDVARFEGQVALEWNLVADPAEIGRYPYEVDTGPLTVLDMRPLVRAAVADFLAGAGPATISARFHNTVVAGTTELVGRASDQVGILPVVLTGGCFQNALLAERLGAALAPSCAVYLHGEVPPGDGGLALGQAIVAGAISNAGAGGRSSVVGK